MRDFGLERLRLSLLCKKNQELTTLESKSGENYEIIHQEISFYVKLFDLFDHFPTLIVIVAHFIHLYLM